MKRSFCFLLVVALLGTSICLVQGDELAQDITLHCRFTSKSTCPVGRLFDGNYQSVWFSDQGRKARVEIALPEKPLAGGLYIQWYDRPERLRIESFADAQWREIAVREPGYLVDYIALPTGVTRLRLSQPDGAGAQRFSRMAIAELHVLTVGQLPAWVQQWQPPAEKADLLVLAAHPDDELLFFGGAIPYYAGAREKAVQVAYLTLPTPYRRLELLDALWLCQLKHYPQFGDGKDAYAMSLPGIYRVWKRSKLLAYVTTLYRRYQPLVVVSHDVHGEYGHGAHQAAADAAQAAIPLSASADAYPDSLRQYGPWQVPKLYLHLYGDHPTTMDWFEPLPAFAGQTAYEIACQAFACHVSQQSGRHVMQIGGPFDNTKFGLAYTAVGEDEAQNDFFEHIPER